MNEINESITYCIILYTNIVLRLTNDNNRYNYKILNLTISLINYGWADF